MLKFFKRSINREYTFVFGLLLCACILLISVVNMLTLGSAYMYNKRKVLLSCYDQINSAAVNGDITSSAFDESLKELSAINNLEVLMIDSEKNIVKSTDVDPALMSKRLLEFVFGGAENVKPMYENDRIRIQVTRDPRMHIDYLELWGSLDNQNLILMRTPVQSMREASQLANTIFIRFGLIALVVGVVFIFLTTRRITRPIKKLVGISEKMTRLDFSEKYESRTENEIDMLGEHMNRMSDRLEQTIMELKSANALLQQDIEKKTQIDEMRKEFLSNVSHELKTPIALIQGYAEGLRDCVNDDPAEREFYCDVITDESKKMNSLVMNLLSLNELESGNAQVDIEHFDITELINNIAGSMEILAKQNGITMKIPDKKDVYVWADELRTEQVLSNYLSNAIHYAKGKKEVSVDLVAEGETVRISVFNTGDNIPEEILPELWTKFYKADIARTREYGGSGLGLSIVKAAMEAMGGDYGAENTEGGVIFWFELDSNASV